jgi:hypothetical protein
MRSPLRLLTLLLIAAAHGQAQGPSRRATPGDTIRVTLTDGWKVSGVLAEVTGAALVTRASSGSGSPISIPLSNVRGLEVLDGRKSLMGTAMTPVKYGALAGTMIGLFLGVGILLSDPDDPYAAAVSFYSTILGLVWGVTAGTVIGVTAATINRSERWVSVPPPQGR